MIRFSLSFTFQQVVDLPPGLDVTLEKLVRDADFPEFVSTRNLIHPPYDGRRIWGHYEPDNQAQCRVLATLIAIAQGRGAAVLQ